MSRYIDADALIESIKCTADLGGWIGEALYQIKQVAIKYIDSAPSIDIVRCAECIWRDKDNQGEDYCTYVKGLADITDDSFCSWGERSRR